MNQKVRIPPKDNFLQKLLEILVQKQISTQNQPQQNSGLEYPTKDSTPKIG
jgi:hypothetical protein